MEDALLEAVRQAEVDEVKRILAEGVEINEVISRSSHTTTPLFAAVVAGEPEVMRALLAGRADVNMGVPVSLKDTWALRRLTGSAGEIRACVSPLRYALEHRAPQGCVDVLVEARADVNKSSLEGRSALACAAFWQNLVAMRTLLEARADADGPDETGRSALFSAASVGSVEGAAMLLERGASVNRRDPSGASPLVHAVRRGRLEITRFLLGARADTELLTESGETALFLAAEGGHAALAGALVQACARLDLVQLRYGGSAGFALAAAAQDSGAACQLFETCCTAQGTPTGLSWQTIEEIAELFAPEAEHSLASWARSAVAVEALRAEQPCPSELRAMLSSHGHGSLLFCFIGVGPGTFRRRLWFGKLLGDVRGKLVVEWDSQRGPDLVAESIGEDLFLLNSPGAEAPAFDGVPLVEHLQRLEIQQGARPSSTAIVQHLLRDSRDLAKKLVRDPAGAARQLEHAVLIELVRQVWPTRRLVHELSEARQVNLDVEMQRVWSLPTPHENQVACGLLRLLAACRKQGCNRCDLAREVVTNSPGSWPSANVLALMAGRVWEDVNSTSLPTVGAASSSPVRKVDSPGPLALAFVRCWSEAESPPLQERLRRLELLRSLAELVDVGDVSYLPACTADQMAALRSQLRECTELEMMGKEVHFVEDFSDPGVVKVGVIRRVLLGCCHVQERDGPGKMRTLARDEIGRTWFWSPDSSATRFLNPSAAFRRSVEYQRLACKLQDAIFEKSLHLEPTIEHVEALEYSYLISLGPESSYANARWAALAELASRCQFGGEDFGSIEDRATFDKCCRVLIKRMEREQASQPSVVEPELPRTASALASCHPEHATCQRGAAPPSSSSRIASSSASHGRRATRGSPASWVVPCADGHGGIDTFSATVQRSPLLAEMFDNSLRFGHCVEQSASKELVAPEKRQKFCGADPRDAGFGSLSSPTAHGDRAACDTCDEYAEDEEDEAFLLLRGFDSDGGSADDA